MSRVLVFELAFPAGNQALSFPSVAFLVFFLIGILAAEVVFVLKDHGAFFSSLFYMSLSDTKRKVTSSLIPWTLGHFNHCPV